LEATAAAVRHFLDRHARTKIVIVPRRISCSHRGYDGPDARIAEAGASPEGAAAAERREVSRRYCHA
jgi:hypothetical protein